MNVGVSTQNCILLLIYFQIYQYLAERLTEKELLRTQTEFDDSLTLKIYLLQFVNYYASIFYIAFFKGKFVGRPGAYIRFLEQRQEEVSENIRFFFDFVIFIVNEGRLEFFVCL